MVSKNKINIEGYGYKRLYLIEINESTELYVAYFKHKKKDIYGVVDNNGRLLVSFSECEFDDIFFNKNKSDFCFTRFNSDKTDYESFHIKKMNDNLFYQRAHIQGNGYTKCRLLKTKKDDFWFIESTTDGITEVSLYSVDEAKILTPGFTEISFEEEKSRVLAYIEKVLYFIDEDGYPIKLASLLAYIDWQGRFLTPLYMPEKDMYYESISYNFDHNFKSYNLVIDSITNQLYKEYKVKTGLVTANLDAMFNNIYTEEELAMHPKTKVLQFRKGQTNEKK